MTLVWAQFAFYASEWHFCGFAGDEDAVREFEDACAADGRGCVVLALAHAGVPLAIAAPRKPWRGTEGVPVDRELL